MEKGKKNLRESDHSFILSFPGGKKPKTREQTYQKKKKGKNFY